MDSQIAEDTEDSRAVEEDSHVEDIREREGNQEQMILDERQMADLMRHDEACTHLYSSEAPGNLVAGDDDPWVDSLAVAVGDTVAEHGNRRVQNQMMSDKLQLKVQSPPYDFACRRCYKQFTSIGMSIVN